MIDIKDKTECCGCFSCKNICPQNAISMIEDEYGFKYPNINYNICTNCGLCEKVCPIINKKKENNEESKAYAAINKDENIRMKSSSGGMFSLIAENIINKSGIVYGASFNENFLVEHSRAETIEEISKFRGSKYIQSDINTIFREVKKDLNSGREVLFTGTPCQVEGLKSYLLKNYDNLYTQDFICHGVPSKEVWKKYLEYRKKQDNDEPKNISFRNKQNKGWNEYQLLFEYNKNNKYIDHIEDLFMKVFLSDISLRDSCYRCEFKKKHRISDITLADFWGINNVVPEMNDEKGTSLLIVNSEKGNKLLKEIQNNAVLKEIDIEQAIKYNKSMIQSANINNNREKFFENLKMDEFENLIDRFIEKK